MGTRHSHAALALLLGTLLTMAACRSDDPSVRPTPTKVVLITIDTLRPDHCSLYGYRRKTTPFLDELAARAVVFDRAYSTSSWTAPAMASLFTSLPPRAHGVVRGFVANEQVVGQDVLSDRFDTLAEILSRNGWQTFGVSTNAHLTTATGFAQGFMEFRSLWWDDAARANTEVLALAERLATAGRWFLWVHYFDPHFPYDHQQPWFDVYASEAVPPVREPVPPDVVKALHDMVAGYDSEIAYVDDHLRKLFAALAIDPSTFVVVVSDHGEAMLEHSTFGHGQSLFEEEVRIPFLVRPSGDVPGRHLDSMVSIADVFPTILDAVGIAPPARLVGRSLVPALRGARLPDATIVTELDRQPIGQHAVRSGAWKLYRRDPPQEFVRLHDLSHDPLERNDLSGAERTRVRDLDAAWDGFAARWPRFAAPTVAQPVGKDQVDRLRALGYLDGH
jgi:arylsulfatase A-like enzyme